MTGWSPDELVSDETYILELRTERDILRVRAANLEADLQHGMQCAERLRELVAIATTERDALRARVAELEAHELEVSRLTGIVYEADYHCHAGPRDQVLGEIERLKGEARDACELRQRVAELSAPPVVPEGWEVSSRHGAWGLLDRHGYAADADETGIMNASIDDYIPWPALRALAWAIEHDQRPPHAGDE